MKRLFLAAGLIAALIPTTIAHAARPAAQETALSAREQALVGTYKTEKAGAPVLTLKAKGTQLLLLATGLPEIPVTLNDKDELTSPLLPPESGYRVRVVRDAEKKITGLDVTTPQGNGIFQRTDEKAAPAPLAVPDILGKYESDQEVDGMILKSEVAYEKGKLVLHADGQPDYTLTLNKDDTLTGDPAFPEGLVVKLVRDKDGKVTGSLVTIADTRIHFTRKTFPAPPAADPAAIPDVLGRYEPADPVASPVGPGEILLREGKLVLVITGQPEYEITIDKDDNITAPNFPQDITARFGKDKDGKVTRIIAKHPGGELLFLRKTFPKAGATPEAKTDAAQIAKLKALEGTYTSETPGLPTVKMRVKDGKLLIEAEGMPAIEGKLSDKDELTGAGLPEGFTVTVQRDKDGKVTGILVKTPMGDATFTRKPTA